MQPQNPTFRKFLITPDRKGSLLQFLVNERPKSIYYILTIIYNKLVYINLRDRKFSKPKFLVVRHGQWLDAWVYGRLGLRTHGRLGVRTSGN